MKNQHNGDKVQNNITDDTVIVKGVIKKIPEIDYKKLNKDQKLKELMD